MCVILVSYKTHPDYKLVIAANRDEFHNRPSENAAFWADSPDVLAGRDLTAGGTWLGVNRAGAFAAVTNFREAGPGVDPSAPSRGQLVSRFLRSGDSPATFVASIRNEANQYAGFSLLVSDGDSLTFHSNRGPGPRFLGPGVYGLSNHLLDTPWPKVARGREKLAAATGKGEALASQLFTLLQDQSVAGVDELPHTGMSTEEEITLSALFIKSGEYGTRSSSVVLVNDREIDFYERTFSNDAGLIGSARHQIEVERHVAALV